MRAIVLPPAVNEPYLQTKEDSLTLADYLQSKLHDLPEIEWVERGDLDRLLSEAKLTLTERTGDASVVLGRLLKADVVLCGHLERGS
jgi:hypothetical protein